ncbi:MAG TPA: glycosyltransferase, partial [Acetobacteraceae bacterium]|nr:glycosyltransferase [Acetobacteraceae bacterium]
MNTDLTVIIPTLDAAALLPASLAALQGERVLVVDGGSRDRSGAIAAALGAWVIATAGGRGAQLAAGVAKADTPWVLLLHADTRLEEGWRAAADAFMDEPDNAGRAGYFRFALDSADPRARRLERMVAWRCRVLDLPYGDQGLLVARATLASVGGIRALPLMEDVDLARRLRGRLSPLGPRAVTS